MKSVYSSWLCFFAFLTLWGAVSSPVAWSYPVAPDPEKTQGDLCDPHDPDFAQLRYQERIPYCRRNVTWHRREQIYNAYSIPETCRDRFTVDHFIPLALGGNNDDINLWPEHVNVKATRPVLEQELFLALDRGEITQQEAINIIVKEKMKDKEKLQRLEAPQAKSKKSACDEPWD